MSNPSPFTIIIITPHGSSIAVHHGEADLNDVAQALRVAADQIYPPPPAS